jgi:hypothetical protein
MKRAAALSVVLATVTATATAAQPDSIPYADVAAALEQLSAQPDVHVERQQGWTIVASSERGNAVQWFFTTQGHPAHPSVIKRTIVDRDGIGFVDLDALCQAPQDVCDRLIGDFRQTATRLRALRPETVTLDIGVTVDRHDRVHVHGLVAEAGKAAELRMDDVFKLVIVPTLNDAGGVLLWTAMYEAVGDDFRLVTEPQLTTLGDGPSAISVSSAAGQLGFSFTRLPAEREPL